MTIERMHIMKMGLDGTIYNVYNPEELPDTQDKDGIAVKFGDVVLPFRKKEDNLPGLYDVGPFYIRRDPSPIESQHYAATIENGFFDFSKLKDTREYMEMKDKERALERSYRLSNEDIYVPVISQRDTPFMGLFKTAIGAKRINTNMYKDRFGSNFNNDRRAFDKTDITHKKAIEIFNKTDVQLAGVAYNMDGDIPNPMATPVVCIMNGDSPGVLNTEDAISFLKDITKKLEEYKQFVDSLPPEEDYDDSEEEWQ